MTLVRPNRVVVVGNGVAGLTAGDSLRAAGFDGDLTIVGAEVHAPYSRPALSKALLLNAADITSHQLPEATHQATELRGIRACGLDVGRKIVLLDDGTHLPYDGLVIASGSRARRLSYERAGDDADELTLRNLEDAIALRRRLASKPSVVVVGGGPLGMEIASACVSAGSTVTLVSRGSPLLHQLGPFLSGVFAAAAVDRGLKIISSGSATLRRSSGAPRVVLPDGTVLEADLVITAVGDIPNAEWLTTSGLLTAGAVHVDTRGRLRPDIVAVGDIAAFPTARGVRRIPLWSSAIEQSKAAVVSLLIGDGAPELSFQPYFWTEQFGLSLKAVGPLPLSGPPRIVEGEPPPGPTLMRWVSGDGAGTAVAINYRIPIPKLRRLSLDPV